MAWAYIILPGVVACMAAAVGFGMGAGFWASFLVYFGAGFVGCALVMLWGGLRRSYELSPAQTMAQIEIEIAALEESIARDARLRAGSPDCLAPLLFRSLARQENHQRRKADAARAPSDFVITAPH